MTVKPDEVWKAAFYTSMPHFVQFFFPERYETIDWEKDVEFLDKELQKLHAASNQKNRVADTLVRLYLKNGKPIWILLHIEVQGYVDTEFPLRVHQMGYRIEDLYGVNPVMLCILTDDDPNFYPTEYTADTWGSIHKTVFHAYKVMDNPPEKFPHFDNPVNLIMEVVYHATQSKKMSDGDIEKLYLPILRKFIEKKYSKKEIGVFVSFIIAYVKFGNQENYRNFETKIENMVDYETREEFLERFWNPAKFMEKELIEKASAEAQKASAEAQKAIERLEHGIIIMLNQGMSLEFLSKAFNLPIEQIEAIQEKYKDNGKMDNFLNGNSITELNFNSENC